MAKIRKIYDQTIKPDGSKTTIYPITSTRAVYTPEGETLDSYLKDGYFHGADLRGYKTVSNVTDLPTTENQFGWLIGEDLYVWVGTGGDTLGGLYQNCGHFRTPYVPDDEDLFADSDNELKLKDRTVEDGGMGYVILRKNKAFAEQVIYTDTIYEVRYDFSLDGESVTIPTGCVLKFNGGSLSNGTLVGDDTFIEAGVVKIFNSDIALDGTFAIPEIYPEWFGSNSQDESPYINLALEYCTKIYGRTVKLSGRTYNISNTINLGSACNLIGQEVKNFVSAGDSSTGTIINVVGDIDGITCASTNGYQHNRQIKYLFIQKDSANKHNKGIYVKSYESGKRLQMKNWAIVGVVCRGFESGFYIDGYGYYGITSNIFSDCKFTNNKIGLEIVCTASDEGSNKSSWVNANYFHNCEFSDNSVGGILFDGMDSEENNFFSECLIEGNGADYTVDDLENNDYLGYGFRMNSRTRYGTVYFNGCYLENNYPQRSNSDGDISADEYEYNGKYYPDDIESISSMIICNKGCVSLENNKLSYSVSFGKYTESSLHMYMNDWQYSLSYMENPTIDYLIQYDINPGNALYLYLYINENTYLRDGFTKNLLKMAPESQSENLKKMDIYLHHPTLRNDVVSGCGGSKGVWKYDAYLGGANAASNNIGFLPNSPMYDVTYLWKAFNNNPDLECTCYVQGVNYALDQPAKVYKKINFIGNDSSAALKAASKQLTLYGDASFRDMLLELVGSNYDSMIVANGSRTLEFVNCTITISSPARHLITSSKPVKVTFKNCTFTFTASAATPFTAVKEQNSQLEFVDCTFPGGVTIEKQEASGDTRPYLSSDAQAGICFFDETLDKPIWSNGAGGWVDASGTAV